MPLPHSLPLTSKPNSLINSKILNFLLLTHPMAATASSSASSSIISIRICNLSFSNSSISLTTNFPLRPFSHKALNLTLRSQSFNLYPLHLHPLPPLAAAAFDGVELAQEDITTEEGSQQDEPEVEQEKIEKPEEQKVSDSNDAGRLYVGNLPYSMTSNQLNELFGEAGNVKSVEIVYDRVTDRSRGFAFVTMGSVEEAKEAIQMFDGSQVGGRTVKVNFPEVPRGGERLVMGPKVRDSYRAFVDSPHKIYAGNLGWALTSQGLRDAFAKQPGILGAKVIYERDSGRSRGFGFVTFETAENADAALQAMNGVEVQGRPLRLNLAAERAPSSPPSTEENTGSNVDSSELVSSAST